jgi:amino acid transporter
MVMTASAVEPASPSLARSAIGLRGVLLISATGMAPAAAVAYSIPAGAGFAGGALTGSVVFAMVGCLFVAVSLGQLSKHLPSAGGFYTYTSNALHPSIGFLVGWIYLLGEALVAPLLFVQLGGVVGAALNKQFGWSFDAIWIAAALVGGVLVFTVCFFGIVVSARAGILAGLFEIGVLLILAIFLIVEAHHNTLAVFGTKYATVTGFTGSSGLIAGSVFSILAFIGFEAVVPLAEETKNPRRTIRLAVVGAVIVVGLVYTVTTYAATAFVGPDKFSGFNSLENGNPWDALTRQVWGAGWIVVLLAICNSTLVAGVTSSNAMTRTLYSMGRIRLAPSALALIHHRHRSPHITIVAYSVFSVGLALVLGKVYGTLTAFALMGTILTACIIVIYVSINLSCLLYYVRFRRAEFNPLMHAVVPILGVAAFVPAFCAATGLGASVFSFVSPLPAPLNTVGPVMAIWILLGIGYLAFLALRHPQRLHDTKTVFVGDDDTYGPLNRAGRDVRVEP